MGRSLVGGITGALNLLEVSFNVNVINHTSNALSHLEVAFSI